jgi:hypothetical protein
MFPESGLPSNFVCDFGVMDVVTTVGAVADVQLPLLCPVMIMRLAFAEDLVDERDGFPRSDSLPVSAVAPLGGDPLRWEELLYLRPLQPRHAV